MKRFTETCKWEKPWFQELDPGMKCLWMYICDRTDATGIWEVNLKVASFMIGKKFTLDDLKVFGDRVQLLKPGKLWVVGFIAFQYGRLSKECRPHLKVFELIAKHGLIYTEDYEVVNRTRVGQVSEGKRIDVFRRDGGKCVYCGSSESLEPDHIVPRKSGGTDELRNLVAACHACNTLKNDKSAAEFISLNPDKQRVSEYLHRVLNTLPDRDKEEEEETEQEEEEETDKGSPEGKFENRTKKETPFDEFWKAYPVRVGKGNARTAWLKHGCDKLLPQILTSILSLRISDGWTKEGGQYIPYPQKWLNRRGWEDELSPRRGDGGLSDEHERIIRSLPILTVSADDPDEPETDP